MYKPIAMENNEEKPTTASNVPDVENQNSNSVADWYNRNVEYDNDYYAQRGNLYRLMDENQKQDLIKNIVHAMSGIDGPDKELAVNLQLCHWFRIDIGLGIAVAKGLDLDLGETMKNMPSTF